LKVSRNDVEKIYAQGVDEVYSFVQTLVDTINDLSARVTKLENMLAKDSSNSNFSPSSDTPKARSKRQKRTQSLREKSGKKPGGQKGHTGTTLHQVSNPTFTKKIEPPNSCGYCGDSLEKSPVLCTEKRQVFDIPTVKFTVTEYRRDVKLCSCGCENKGEYPTTVTSHVQYGPNIRSQILYFNTYHFIPVHRCSEICSDLYSLSISPGTIVNIINEASDRLGVTISALRKKILSSPAVNFDESGFYVMGDRYWLHSASTATETLYISHTGRGYEAMDSGEILPFYKGTAVHDYWKSYYHYVDCTHSLCNVHHLRELKFIQEQYQQKWAYELSSLLIRMKKSVEEALKKNKKELGNNILEKYRKEFDELIDKGLDENPPAPKEKGKRGAQKQSVPHNFLMRFKTRSDEVLRFLYDFTAPFSNNQAERDIRMIKLKQKISGCFRSVAGAEAYCRIRSFISSARKQGKGLLQTLALVFTHDADSRNLLAE